MSTILSISWAGILVYIPTILFILIILFGILSGFRRGLRKSVILFINMLIAFAVTIVLFYLIFRNGFDERFVTYLNQALNPFGLDLQELLGTHQSYNTLSGYLQELVANTLPDNYYTDASLVQIIGAIMAIAESLTKLVMLLVLLIIYFLVKFILYIFYLIFFKEGRRKKKINRQFSEGLRSKPYSKRRGLGSLVGLVRGSIIALLLFSFIGSLFYVLSGGSYSKTKEEVNVTIDDKTYEITEYYDIVNRYGTVGIGKILESVKNSEDVPLYLLAADYITKGSYEIENEDGTTSTNSLYGRRELGPVVGLVKEIALTAIDYNIDLNRINETEYLIDFMSKDNVVEEVAFCDKLDQIIDKYSFGDYTLYLSQCFVKSIADASIQNSNEDDFTGQLLNVILCKDNRIKPSDLVTNENVKSILHLLINVSSNYDELNTFMDRFKSTEETQELVFGIKKAKTEDKEAEAVKECLDKVQSTINSLTFLKDGKSDKLLSDVVILVFEKMIPNYSLNGINKVDDIYSIYNIKWQSSLSTIFSYLRDIVSYVSDNSIYSENELIDTLLTDLADQNSNGYKLVFNIVGNEILGVFLNADGLKELVNEALSDMHITMPNNIALGNYYNNGTLVHGEIYNLLKSVSTKAKELYDIFTDEKLSQSNKLSQLFSEETGLIDTVKAGLDITDDSYSSLLHYIVSNVIVSINDYDLQIRIYIPSEIQENNNGDTYIKSSELVTICNLLSTIAPNIFAEEIDYASLLTSENINAFMDSEILKSTLAITAYDQLANNEEINAYIPSSLSLKSDTDIENNIDKWVGGEGELDYIVDALTTGDLLSRLFNNNSLSTNDLISIVMDMDSSSISTAMKSNVLNTIITGKLSDVSFGEASIIVPLEAKIEQIDGLDRIDGKQMSNLLVIAQKSGIDEVITSESENQTNILIEKILTMDEETRDLLINSYILNATVTSFLTTLTMSGGSNSFNIIIPLVSLQQNKSCDMIDITEFDAVLDAVSSLLNGNYDFTKIDFNRLLDSTVIDTITNSAVISATIINALLTLVDSIGEAQAKYIKIPEIYKVTSTDLKQAYLDTRWTVNSELSKMLKCLGLIGLSFDENNSVVIEESEILKISIDAALPDSKLNSLLASEILYTSISNVILGLDSITVLDVVKSKLFTDGSVEDSLNNTTILKKELIEMFSSVEKLLGAETIEAGVSVDTLSDYITIDYLKEHDKLNKATIISLLDSVIFETKLSEVIKDAADGRLCVVDTLNFKDTTDSRIFNWLHIDENNNIKPDEGEVRKLINALDALNLISMLGNLADDFELDNILTLSDVNIKSVLESDLIHATFIDSFYNNATISEALSLPTVYQLTDGSTDYIAKNFTSMAMYKNHEVFNIIKAIATLGLKLNSLSINNNILLSLNEPVDGELTKLNIVALSDVIWFTLSTKLFNLSYLNIPEEDIVDKDRSTTDKFVLESEIESLINATKVINYTDLDAEFDVNTVLSADMSVLCASKIIWLTMSMKLKDISAIKVPKGIYANSSNLYDSKGIYLLKEEIQALTNGLKTLNITEFSSFNLNNILKQDTSTIWRSSVLRFTATSNISSVEVIKISVLDVEIINNVTDEYIITEEELTKFMNAIICLGLGDINNIKVDLSTVTENVNNLLTSNIIAESISWQMFDSNLKVNVKDTVKTTLYNNNQEVYNINSNDIKDFINAAKTFGLSSYGDSPTVNNKSSVNTLATSSILMTTYNSQVLLLIEANNKLGANLSKESTLETIVTMSGNVFKETQEEILTDSAVKGLVNYLKF